MQRVHQRQLPRPALEEHMPAFVAGDHGGAQPALTELRLHFAVQAQRAARKDLLRVDRQPVAARNHFNAHRLHGIAQAQHQLAPGAPVQAPAVQCTPR